MRINEKLIILAVFMLMSIISAKEFKPFPISDTISLIEKKEKLSLYCDSLKKEGKDLSKLYDLFCYGQPVFGYHFRYNRDDLATILWELGVKPDTVNTSPLILAARLKKYDSIDSYIEQYDINKFDTYEYRPLEYALYNEAFPLIKKLIDKGADIERRNKKGYTIIPRVINATLEHPANSKKALKWNKIYSYLMQNVKKYDMIFMGSITYLHLASAMGDTVLANKAIQAGIDINFRSNDGYTPLMQAAYYNRKDMIAFLLSKGADINITTVENKNVLSQALTTNNTSLAKFLLAKGASLNKLREPLREIVSDCKDSTVSFIVENWDSFNFNELEIKKEDLLRKAIDRRRERLIPILVKIIPSYKMTMEDLESCISNEWEAVLLKMDSLNLISLSESQLDTVLFTSIKAGMSKFVNVLVNKGANLNSCIDKTTYYDTIKQNPFSVALDYNYSDIAFSLLKNGFDINNSCAEIKNPLESAIYSKNINFIKELVDKGFSPKEYVKDEDSYGVSFPFYTALKTYNKSVVELIGEYQDWDSLSTEQLSDLERWLCRNITDSSSKEIVEYLLSKGISINTPNYKEGEVLNEITEEGNIEDFEYVAKKGLTLENAKCDYPPLFTAIQRASVEKIDYIIDKSPSMNDSIVSLALYMSTWSYEKFTSLWKNIKPSVVKRNISLDTIFTGALLKNGDAKVIEFLEKKGAKIKCDCDTYDIAKICTNAIQSNLPYIVKQLWVEYSKPDEIIEVVVEQGDLELLKWLVKDGADVNLKFGRYSRSLLHKAIESDKPEMLKYLIKKKLPVNEGDDYDETPLYDAIYKDNVNCVKILLAAGADTVSLKKKYGESLYSIAQDKRSYKVAELFAPEKKDDDYENDYSNRSRYDEKILTKEDSLAYALREGIYYKVKDLINSGTVLNSSRDRKPLLFSAVRNNYYEITKMLIDAGADLFETYDGESIIEYAIDRQHSDDLIHLLLSRSIVHAKDNKEKLKNVLHDAVRAANIPIIEEALSKGADPNSKIKFSRYSDPRSLAEAALKVPELMKILLRYNLDINNGSLLSLSLQEGDAEVSKMLIEAGADISAFYEHERTPIFYCRDESILKMLLDKGADINSVDSLQMTPLMSIVMDEDIAAARLFIMYGADPNQSFNNECKSYGSVSNGYTSLEIACENEDSSMVSLLLSLGATGNGLTGKDGNNNPIDIAIKNDQSRIVELLLNNGIPYHDMLKVYTFLFNQSLEKGNVELAKEMIKKGVDVNGKIDDDYRYSYYRSNTPLERALESKALSIIKLLIENGAELLTEGRYDKEKKSCKILEDIIDKATSYYSSKDKDSYLEIANYIISKLPINELSESNVEDILKFAIHKNNVELLKGIMKNSVGDKDALNEIERFIYNNSTSSYYNDAPFTKELYKLILNDFKTDFKKDVPLVALSLKLNDVEILDSAVASKNVDINEVNKKGKNALWYYYYNDTLAVPYFKKLIEAGISLDVQDRDGETILFRLIYNGKNELIDLVINHGINCTLKNDDGLNAFQYAAEKGSLKTVKQLHSSKKFEVDKLFIKTLLTAGNKDKTDWILSQKDKYPDVGSMLSYALTDAVKNSDMKSIKYLVSLGVDPKMMNPDSVTPLSQAISSNSSKNVFKYLISKGIDINSYNIYGVTPLIEAISKGQDDVVTLLLSLGVDINAADKQLGISPLSHLLMKSGSFYDVEKMIGRFLKHGADIKHKDNQGWTLLHYALRYSRKETIDYLIGRGISVDIKDVYGKTPLYFLMSLERRPLRIGCQLVKNGAEINTVTLDGSLLHLAVKEREPEIVSELISLGIDTSLKDRNGKTALDIAKEENYKKVLKILQMKVVQNEKM